MSSYRRIKHVYNDNWEDSHPFKDLVPMNECDDPEEEFDCDGDLLTVAAELDTL